MRYLNDWIWLRLSNRYNVTSATHSLADVYDRWVRSTAGSLGVDLVDFYRQRVPDAESLNDAEYIYWSGGPLQDAVLWLDAQSVTTGHTTVPNLGSGGSVLNAQYGNGSTASTFPTLLEHTGQNYLYLPGVAGNYASTPDAAVLDITGDIDIRVRVAMDDWTPSGTQAIIAKSAAGGIDDSWQIYLLSSGVLRFGWSTTGAIAANADSTVATGIADGAVKWIRFTMSVGSPYQANWYLSDDGVTWSQLGATIAPGGSTSFFASSQPVTVGSVASGTSAVAAGKFYRAQIRSGINGTVVFDADFTKLVNGSQTAFVEDSTNAATVTINRATSGRKTVVVTRPVWLFGTDDYMEIVDNALLDFGATQDFTVLAMARAFGSTDGVLVSKKNSGTLSVGWWLRRLSNFAVQFLSDDGVAPQQGSGITCTTSNSGEMIVYAARRTGGINTGYMGSCSGASVDTKDMSTSSFPLRIGATSQPLLFFDGEIFAVAVWRRALTAAEIAQVVQYYGLSSVPSWAHLVLDEEGVPILDENGDVIETE